MSTEGEDSIERALQTLAARLDGLEERVERLDGLEPRVAILEVGLLRVERQLHLVFEQCQALSRAQGEAHALLRSINETVTAIAMRGA